MMDMNRDWIIDVLADLKAFAETNGMDATAAGLEDAALVALAEIAALERPRAVVEAEVAQPEYGPFSGNVTSLFAYHSAS